MSQATTKVIREHVVATLPRGFVLCLAEPRVEPLKRLVGGKFGWAVHRFPIKGGISLQHALNADMREMLDRPSYFQRKFLEGKKP